MDARIFGSYERCHAGHGEFGAPIKTFAIGFGCDLSHASRVAYAKGLNLAGSGVAVPIGVAAKSASVRIVRSAFPPIGGRTAIEENQRRFTPYPVADGVIVLG